MAEEFKLCVVGHHARRKQAEALALSISAHLLIDEATVELMLAIAEHLNGLLSNLAGCRAGRRWDARSLVCRAGGRLADPLP